VRRPTLARTVALEVLRAVFEEGEFADRSFRAAAERERLSGRERAQAQRLAYGAVQRRGTSDHLIAELANRPVGELDRPLVAALRLGLYELLFMEGTPDHAAVDQAVELAREEGGSGGTGLVNAVLRRAIRERTRLLAGLSDVTRDRAAVMHSHPPWLARMWWTELGPDSARSLMAANNEPMETALRANPLRADPAATLKALQEAAIDAHRPDAPPPLAPPEAVIVDGPLGEAALERIRSGALTPQARASMAVVDLLDPQPGERVLDLCAAPGIKATQIAARMGDRGEIVAVELDAKRASELRATCERMGVRSVRVIEADAAEADLGSSYDRVLVDPPCSDLGTLAARPDARWRKSPELIDRVATLQRRILTHAAPALKPGGRLVYSTCTISRRENEALVSRLVDPGDLGLTVERLGDEYQHVASAVDPRFLQTRPDRDGTDGFFIARMRSGVDS
jgi:16S rRNA (cytosine967-C5)-methyltransferase